MARAPKISESEGKREHNTNIHGHPSWTSLNREFKCVFIYILGQNKARDNIFYSRHEILTDLL